MIRGVKKLLLFLSIICPALAYSQDIPGYNSSNYAGVSGIDLQPASIADMRYKFDMTLIGAGFTFGNNYIGIHSANVLDRSVTKTVPDFGQAFLDESRSSRDKAINLNTYVQLPSFALSISKRISVGLTIRERTMFNMDHMSADLAHLFYSGLKFEDPINQTLWQKGLNNDHFNINQMSWAEYGFDFAMVIQQKGAHFLKAGGRVKYIQGITATYLYARNLTYNWKNKDTLSLINSQFAYGHSDNLTALTNGGTFNTDNLRNATNPSVGFDIGAVYEWRPDYENYLYDMDGKTNLERRDKEKYKVRIGASILDIGRIKFTKGNSTYDFNANIHDWPVNTVKLGSNPVMGVDSVIRKVFPNPADAKTYFNMNLPTAFSIQVDYNIHKRFYVNFTSYTSPRWLSIESKVHAVSYYSITPRWDAKWIGVFVPMGLNAYGQGNIGTTLRLGPIIVGSNNVWSNMIGKNIHGIDAHFAIKIPIFQGKPPRDRDHDKVSDKKDKCKDKPGTWEHHGCPDTDGDGVYDDEDKCPDNASKTNHGCPTGDADGDGVNDDVDSCKNIAGPAENHGCPWGDADKDSVPDNLDSCKTIAGPASNHGCPWKDTDGDGVTDNLDSCKTIAGSPDNHGCPFGDSDKDGVPDNQDKCPDQAGPKENNGCPWGDTDKDGVPDNLDKCPNQAGPKANNGCPYGDKDGDGVADNLDKCPDEAGPASNNGCPVITKQEKEVIDMAVRYLEFELNKAEILPSSSVRLDDLAALLKKHPNFKLKIDGYTDNSGTKTFNMDLSKQRANAVKEALVQRGIPASALKVNYHGQNNPIGNNATEAGRAKNRRVEMKLVSGKK